VRRGGGGGGGGGVVGRVGTGCNREKGMSEGLEASAHPSEKRFLADLTYGREKRKKGERESSPHVGRKSLGKKITAKPVEEQNHKN